MGGFNDKVAMVTGGASGIGRALGEELARRGAVVVLADVNGDGVKDVAAGIVKGGGRARGVELDVTDASAVQALVDEVVAEHGRLDYMFNNAGISIGSETYELDLSDWRRVLDVNLMGVVNGVAAAYPLMVKQGFGHIVNTGSLASLSPLPLSITYATSKHAILGLSTTLRAEGADLGVKVSVTCPGFTDTGIYHSSKVVNLNRERMLSLLPKGVPAHQCARDILRGVEKNKAIIVTTALGKMVWLLNRLSPAFYASHVARLVAQRSREQCRTRP